MKRGRPGRRPPLVGSVRVPGDKSISHRALILAGVAEGTSKISGLNQGADVMATASALRAVGVSCRLEETEAVVEGLGFRGLSEASDVIHAGNSGTTLRIMAGVCVR